MSRKPLSLSDNESQYADNEKKDREMAERLDREMAEELAAQLSDEDDDIYGDLPVRTPALKRRKRGSVTTPISAVSKSTASSVFSPADSFDTPATSVSGSIRKPARGMSRPKRKFAQLESDSEESEYDEDNAEYNASEVEEDALSVAPTVASENSAEVAVAVPRRRPRAARPRRKPSGPRLSQWERTNNALIVHHPELACIWDELENAPLIQPVKVPQPDGLSLQLLPFQLEGLDWLLKQEQQERFNGGILADEMGMGKTIQTIALLLAEPRGKPNLVIAPTVALMQWKQEIETHTNNGLSVCLFYGANRSVTAKEIKNYDVVLTTCMPSISLLT
jgi:DNA repair protein RAD16